MSSLNNQLVAAEQEDIARAVRLLLRHPLITERADPDAFDLVRRRAQPLAQWFDYYCGWTLLTEPRRGYARLVKVGTGQDASRPARRARSGRAPFDRRRYTLLCVAAAELLTTPVTTIGLLADRIARACAVDPLLPGFDTARRAERMAFVDVLRLLESFAAVEVLDGSSDSFVESADAKVLYRVDATLLVRLLSAPVGPSQLAFPDDQVESRFDDLLAGLLRERRYGGADRPPPPGPPPPEAGPEGIGPEGGAAAAGEPVGGVQRGLWLRHSILRRLLDDPVLYRSDLSPAQLEYLASPTGRQLVRRAAVQAGFVLEERAEGYLLVDPEALSTDTTFPSDGSHARITALLLLDGLRPSPARPPEAGPAGTHLPETHLPETHLPETHLPETHLPETGLTEAGLTEAELEGEVRSILARFPAWAKAHHGEDGPARLGAEAVTVLEEFGLAVRIDGRVRARPAAARYLVTGARLKPPAGRRVREEPL